MFWESKQSLSSQFQLSIQNYPQPNATKVQHTAANNPDFNFYKIFPWKIFRQSEFLNKLLVHNNTQKKKTHLP